MENNKDRNRKITIIILIIIIIILLYLLIHMFGDIENHGNRVPTGNVDIFEINCGCKSCECKPCENTEPVFNESGLTVVDDYKVWDNKELRIFSNPAYEYESKIAPGSNNSYTFVIRNNNDFDVLVDITAKEDNKYGVNMKYKLRHNGDYVLGSENEYINAENLKVEKVLIKAHDQKGYLLDWEWVDSDNDTEVGFDVNADYKLTIDINAVGA